VVTGTLEQGLDLGEAGIEVDLAERRAVIGHQAFEAQFQNGVGHPLHGHAVDAVLELLDVEHGFTSILYLYTAYEHPLLPSMRFIAAPPGSRSLYAWSAPAYAACRATDRCTHLSNSG
jgi:hypothetical protein